MHMDAATVRRQDPWDFLSMVNGWNRVHSGDKPEPMSGEEFDKVKEKYG